MRPPAVSAEAGGAVSPLAVAPPGASCYTFSFFSPLNLLCPSRAIPFLLPGSASVQSRSSECFQVSSVSGREQPSAELFIALSLSLLFFFLMRNLLGIKLAECYLNYFPRQVSQTLFFSPTESSHEAKLFLA